jgi:hypothetical protein
MGNGGTTTKLLEMTVEAGFGCLLYPRCFTCYQKDGGGWKIAGYIGGAGGQD